MMSAQLGTHLHAFSTLLCLIWSWQQSRVCSSVQRHFLITFFTFLSWRKNTRLISHRVFWPPRWLMRGGCCLAGAIWGIKTCVFASPMLHGRRWQERPGSSLQQVWHFYNLVERRVEWSAFQTCSFTAVHEEASMLGLRAHVEEEVNSRCWSLLL